MHCIGEANKINHSIHTPFSVGLRRKHSIGQPYLSIITTRKGLAMLSYSMDHCGQVFQQLSVTGEKIHNYQSGPLGEGVLHTQLKS